MLLGILNSQSIYGCLHMIIKQIIAGVQMNKFQRKRFKKPRKYFPGFPYLPLSIKPLSAPCSMPYLPPWKEAYFSSTHESRPSPRETAPPAHHDFPKRNECPSANTPQEGQIPPRAAPSQGIGYKRADFSRAGKEKRNHPCCHCCQNADSNRENLFI